MDTSKVSNIVFCGIDHKDYPKYCDAYIVSADYEDKPMDSDQIEELNQDAEFVNEQLHKHLF